MEWCRNKLLCNIAIISLMFAIACTKNTTPPRIDTRQLPSKVIRYEYDTLIGAENPPCCEIKIDYNFELNRYDSIRIGDTRKFDFDYSKFANEGILLAAYSDIHGAYDRIHFNTQKNIIEKLVSNGETDSTIMSFDSLGRILSLQYDDAFSPLNSSIDYVYKYDTVFRTKKYNSGTCEQVDTLLTIYKKFNNQLPYLMLSDFYSPCNIRLRTSLLHALPTSGYNYAIPRTVLSGENMTSFTYTADAKGRLASLSISTINRLSLRIVEQRRYVLAY